MTLHFFHDYCCGLGYLWLYYRSRWWLDSDSDSVSASQNGMIVSAFVHYLVEL